KVRSIGKESVVEMAQRFFDTQRLVITVVADRERVESKLGQLGELRVYDTDGNPL
ncbi:MAG: hypothetical protein IIB03_10605, partial [Acidobacteria bacterium]|nr:hypothetical protein [Acidobacteriota bacterium]